MVFVFYAVTLSLSQRWLLACDPVTLGLSRRFIIIIIIRLYYIPLSFSAWLDHVVVRVFFCCHTLHRVKKLRVVGPTAKIVIRGDVD